MNLFFKTRIFFHELGELSHFFSPDFFSANYSLCQFLSTRIFCTNYTNLEINTSKYCFARTNVPTYELQNSQLQANSKPLPPSPSKQVLFENYVLRQ